MEFNERRWLLVANGPGPALAGRAVDIASSEEKVDVVISTGFCGALDPALAASDIFVASRVEAVEQAASFPALIPDTARAFASGTLVSADRFVGAVEEKRSLRQTGASAVDMEAAAVASRARAAGLPFFCIRVVTDCAEEGFSIDFNTVRDTRGRFSRARILGSACARPWVRFPELFHIHRRCHTGAQVLGDFLADCRF